MSEAEILFNSATSRFVLLMNAIFSFEEAAKIGIDSVHKSLEESAREHLGVIFDDEAIKAAISQENIDFKKMLTDGPANIARSKQERAKKGVNAAAIVFAHSALDSVLLDYCRVSTLAMPQDWETEVADRSIKIKDLKGQAYQALIAKKLQEYCDQLERESILKKIDHLFRVARPKADQNWMRQYEFDRDHIERLDRLRYEIVHGGALKGDIPDTQGEAWYLFQTGFFFMSCIMLRYALKINSSSLVGHDA